MRQPHRALVLLTFFVVMVLLSACTSAKQKDQQAKEAAAAVAAQKKAEDDAAKKRFEDTMREAGNRIALSYMNLAQVAGTVMGLLRDAPRDRENAIAVAGLINKDKIAKVREERAEIDKNMAVLKSYKESPAEFRVQYEALSQWYDNYVEFTNLATEPPMIAYSDYNAAFDAIINKGAFLNQAYVKLTPKPTP